MIRRINLFLDFIFRIFLTFGIGFVLFFIYRWLYYHHVINEQDGIIPSGMFSRAFLTGLRFDSVVIAYGLVLPLTLALTGIFIRKENYFPKIYRFASVFIGILFSLFVFILVVDYYYYEYFQAHINILIFGFFQDDTGAVLQSVWSDYPLVRVLLGLLGTVLLFRFIFKNYFIYRKRQQIIPCRLLWSFAFFLWDFSSQPCGHLLVHFPFRLTMRIFRIMLR